MCSSGEHTVWLSNRDFELIPNSLFKLNIFNDLTEKWAKLVLFTSRAFRILLVEVICFSRRGSKIYKVIYVSGWAKPPLFISGGVISFSCWKKVGGRSSVNQTGLVKHAEKIDEKTKNFYVVICYSSSLWSEISRLKMLWNRRTGRLKKKFW